VPIEVPDAPTQVAEPVEAETDQDADIMTKRKMTVDHFILGSQPPAQPQGGDHAPFPFAASCPKKK